MSGNRVCFQLRHTRLEQVEFHQQRIFICRWKEVVECYSRMMSTEQLPFSWDTVQKRPKPKAKPKLIFEVENCYCSQVVCMTRVSNQKPEERVHTLRLCATRVTVRKFCLFFFKENEMSNNTANSDSNGYKKKKKRSDRVAVNCNRRHLKSHGKRRRLVRIGCSGRLFMHIQIQIIQNG